VKVVADEQNPARREENYEIAIASAHETNEKPSTQVTLHAPSSATYLIS
jgi:hypothetical protein